MTAARDPARGAAELAAVDAEPEPGAADERIANARRVLAARLAELERRVDGVKEHLDPRTWIENPWVRVGIAAGLGFALGRSRVVGPLLRTAVGAAVGALVRQAFARPAG